MWLRDVRCPLSSPSRIALKSNGLSSPSSKTRETSRLSNLSMHNCSLASKQLSATTSERRSNRTNRLCRSYSNWLSHTSMRNSAVTQSLSFATYRKVLHKGSMTPWLAEFQSLVMTPTSWIRLATRSSFLRLPTLSRRKVTRRNKLLWIWSTRGSTRIGQALCMTNRASMTPGLWLKALRATDTAPSKRMRLWRRRGTCWILWGRNSNATAKKRRKMTCRRGWPSLARCLTEQTQSAMLNTRKDNEIG